MYVRGLFQCDVCLFHFVVRYLSAIEYCQFYNTLTCSRMIRGGQRVASVDLVLLNVSTVQAC